MAFGGPCGDIVNLNVGGTRFSTSRQTLSQLPDTFFTALLSGRISTLRDENGAIFIDRDPQLFSLILSYLRTREIDITKCKISVLLHEAEFYNIQPLVKRLMLCEDLSYSSSSCGDILFYGYLTPPNVPVQDAVLTAAPAQPVVAPQQQTPRPTESTDENEDTISQRSLASANHNARPGQMVRVPENGNRSSTVSGQGSQGGGHSRNSSWDMRVGPSRGHSWSHSRTASLDMRHAEMNKFLRNDIAQLLNQSTVAQIPPWHDPLRVQIIKAHHNWICVSYAHFLTCYRLKDSVGWQLVFTSPYIEHAIERVALNAKVSTGTGPGGGGGAGGGGAG